MLAECIGEHPFSIIGEDDKIIVLDIFGKIF